MPTPAASTESELKVVTWRPPTAEELRSLLFAWRVCKHVKSNAIVYARDGQTLGVGAGQMSRVDAARFGAMKAVLPLKGCVAASDAFFPFPDGLEAVAQAGATAVIQPGGSVRDEEVIAAADKLGMAMVFTGHSPLPALTLRTCRGSSDPGGRIRSIWAKFRQSCAHLRLIAGKIVFNSRQSCSRPAACAAFRLSGTVFCHTVRMSKGRGISLDDDIENSFAAPWLKFAAATSRCLLPALRPRADSPPAMPAGKHGKPGEDRPQPRRATPQQPPTAPRPTITWRWPASMRTKPSPRASRSTSTAPSRSTSWR